MDSQTGTEHYWYLSPIIEEITMLTWYMVLPRLEL